MATKKKKFNLLFTFFILLAIPLTVWLVKNFRSEIAIRANENLAPVSQWIPINLGKAKEDLKQEIKNLELEIQELEKLNIPINEKNKRKNVIERSLKIKELLLKEYALMDKNKNGEIAYDEFHTRIVPVSQKIYDLRHPKVQNRDNGLYDSLWGKVTTDTSEQLQASSTNILAVVIEANLYEDIYNSLKQYKIDLKKEGYDAQFFLCNRCTKEETKKLLRTLNAVGVVFVGDLPIAWYQTRDCFGWEGYVENFPIDLYFMDLNGKWSGNVDCGDGISCFTVHEGDIGPEIFLGRITAPSEDQEISLIKNYFRKNHLFRTNIIEGGLSEGVVVRNASLNYVDDDWYLLAKMWSEEIGVAYPSYNLINDPKTTTAQNYKRRWEKYYEHLLIAAHSNPLAHYFEVPDGDGSWVYYSEVRDLKPYFFFHNLFACSNALFVWDNYMAGWYVFQESDFGLLAIGSTKTGAMLNFRDFYQPLSKGQNFGMAFKKWFNFYAADKCWFGGMTIIGDPTLKKSP